MANRAAVILNATNGNVMYAGGSTNYFVQIPDGTLYFVYINPNADVYFRKSTDNGLTWSQEIAVSSAAFAILGLSVWYEKWSGLSGGKIHCAYTDTTNDDVYYRSIDTASSDALSTETLVFAGTTAVNPGGALSITAARSGYLYILLCIDNGAESDFALSTDTGATWDLTRASAGSFESGGGDMWIMLPGWAADSNDIMCIFWDVSNNEISRKLYDHSGDAWAETSISTGMVEVSADTAFPNFAAAVDIANSQNILIAWNGIDTANADLKCWTVTESAITANTDVVTNGTDDQALCGLSIDTGTGYWYAYYAGKSDGSETAYSALNVYYKVSQDGGTTWGAETQISGYASDVRWLACIPRFANQWCVAWSRDSTAFASIKCSAPILQPRATMMIGM